MTDTTETERWLGVYRSVSREPIGEARFARVQRHRRRGAIDMLGGVGCASVPFVAMALFAWTAHSGLIAVIAIGFLLGPAVGGLVFADGIRRRRHLREIHPDSEVEIFEGVAGAPSFTLASPAPPVGLVSQDSVTQRLIGAGITQVGRRHRLAVHADTGLVLDVDGQLLEQFIGGDVSVTARLPTPSTTEPEPTSRVLSALERHELVLVERRLVGPTKRLWAMFTLCTSAAVLGVLFNLEQHWNIGSLACGAMALLAPAAVSAYGMVRLRRWQASLARDREAGCVRERKRWMLPESGICWEESGHPGAARLTGGGLGPVATGTSRPMSF